MKLIKRTMTKGEIVYETNRGEEGTYQSVVSIETLACANGNIFTGEECASKQEAEHSAAGVALDEIMATPEHAQTLEDRAREPPRKRQKGEGKGKGKSDVKGNSVDDF